jgi:DivIVA domain-containing protein
MKPNDVHAVAFHKASFPHRGYDEESVDLLLDRVEATLGGQAQITPGELSVVAIRKSPLGKRGYDKTDVDAFIARVISEWSTAG